MTMARNLLKDTRIHLLAPGEIILVDDDPEVRAALRTLLNDNNYKVVCLESAEHAMRYVQSQRLNWYPWLVITDLVMDGMGGYQLLRRIQELYPKRKIPMVVISKLGTADDMAEAEEAGAAAFLKKPLDEDKLLQTIKKVTNKKRITGILRFDF
jgi:CheY-like chemotaxis protein